MKILFFSIFAHAHVCITGASHLRASHSYRDDTHTLQPSITAVSYLQSTVYLSRAASLYARVTQPARARELNRLGPGQPRFSLSNDALNVTSSGGIVYVANTSALQRAPTSFRVQVRWTVTVTETVNLTVVVVDSPQCDTHDHQDNLCSALTQRECARTTCAYGLGSLTNSTSGAGAHCQWIANSSSAGPGAGYATCSVQPATCPDLWCDPLERLSYNLTCLQDCTRQVLGAGGVRPDQGHGISPLTSSAFCSCDHFSACYCIGQPRGQRRATVTVPPHYNQTALINSNSSQYFPEFKIKQKIGCGFKCQTKAAIGVTVIISSCLFLLLFISNRRQGDKVTRELGRNPSPIPAQGINRGDQLTFYTEPDPRWEHPRNSLLFQQCLGEGEFGRVLKATARDIGGMKGETTVAVKTLKTHASNAELRALLSEYHVMRDVSHPNVIRLLGACTDPSGPLYLIMEYAEHGSLRNYIRRSRISSSRFDITDINHISYKKLLGFAWQISKGMAYLADNKLVHRDLAARNVLLATDYICKISDFGLSRDVYEDNAYHKRSKGRVPVKWMALESLSDHVYTTRSDVWSFGVVLWELVTLGCSPYPGVVLHNLFHLLNAGYRMEQPHTCTDSLYELMLSCWKKKPLERPPFTQITEHLEKIMEEGEDYLPLQLEKRLVINRGYDAISSPEEDIGVSSEAFNSTIPDPEQIVKHEDVELNNYENNSVKNCSESKYTYDTPRSLWPTNGLQLCYKSHTCSFNNLGSNHYKVPKTNPQIKCENDTTMNNYDPMSTKQQNYAGKTIGFIKTIGDKHKSRVLQRPLSEYITMNNNNIGYNPENISAGSTKGDFDNGTVQSKATNIEMKPVICMGENIQCDQEMFASGSNHIGKYDNSVQYNSHNVTASNIRCDLHLQRLVDDPAWPIGIQEDNSSVNRELYNDSVRACRNIILDNCVQQEVEHVSVGSVVDEMSSDRYQHKVENVSARSTNNSIEWQ